MSLTGLTALAASVVPQLTALRRGGLRSGSRRLCLTPERRSFRTLLTPRVYAIGFADRQTDRHLLDAPRAQWHARVRPVACFVLHTTVYTGKSYIVLIGVNTLQNTKHASSQLSKALWYTTSNIATSRYMYALHIPTRKVPEKVGGWNLFMATYTQECH